ncbi:hypothetical protein D9619_009837 [Psilocybe cf. subviscida]|uniref:Uncharacterized protein n=1 Tax=Psilocybe cf. subviscida TaxID=2480587 RepID=A0A8H5BKM6_9AGAR|nr:hypothetical protein D9619_009837 [Psilocybe cf. subviscida]
MQKEDLPRSTKSFGSAALRATKKDEVNRKVPAAHDRARASYINFYELWKATKPAIRQPRLPLSTPPSSDIYQIPPEQPPTTPRFNVGHRMDRRQSGLPRNRKWRATIRVPPLPLSTPSATPRRMDRRQRRLSQDRKGKAPIWEPPLPLSTPPTTTLSLKEAREDLNRLKQLLINKYDIEEKDIIFLLDDGGDGHVQPTRGSIILALHKLVSSAPPLTDFIFAYTGHSSQEIVKAEDREEDGRDEYIMPLDGSTIHDTFLREILVDPIEEFSADEPQTATTRETSTQNGHRAPTASTGEASSPAPATAEDAPPSHHFSTDEPEFTGPGPPDYPSPSWSQNHEDDQWRPGEPAHEEPPPSKFPHGQDDGFTGEGFPFDLLDVDEPHSNTAWSRRGNGVRPKSGARPGHGSQSMFANAKNVKVSGSTFVTVAHNYEAESPVFSGGPAFPIAVLSLQAVSFATRSNYPYFGHQLDLQMMASPPSVNVALQFPSLFHEMKIMVTLWLFFKMWVRQRAGEHH